ncbi:MAG TPA: hypothetical protein DCR87_05815 [Acidobacteria bacterium]|nr:hypothetical protein [Acidobacteriota bacterium]
MSSRLIALLINYFINNNLGKEGFSPKGFSLNREVEAWGVEVQAGGLIKGVPEQSQGRAGMTTWPLGLGLWVANDRILWRKSIQVLCIGSRAGTITGLRQILLSPANRVKGGGFMAVSSGPSFPW